MSRAWKDTTSYSRSESPRIPRVWEWRGADELVRIVVHRMHGDPDNWYYSCNSIGVAQSCLGAVQLPDAQESAIKLVRKQLQMMLREVGP